MPDAMTYEQRAAALKAPTGSPLAHARIAAHAALDSLWQGGLMSRSAAYNWLADQLDLQPADCHIAFFDEATCLQVKAVCDQRFFKEMFDV